MRIVLCYTQRSGSWLLTHALNGTRVAGRSREHYHDGKFLDWAQQHPNQNWLDVALKASTTRNGVSGLRVHWNAWSRLHKRAGCEDLVALHLYLKGPRYLLTLRHDKERQAISMAKAIQTGVWFKPKDKLVKVHEPPTYNFEQVINAEFNLRFQELQWMNFFESVGARPIVTYYEDLESDLDGSVIRILDDLGIDRRGAIVPDTKLIKQSDQSSEEWLEQYKKDKVTFGHLYRPPEFGEDDAGHRNADYHV